MSSTAIIRNLGLVDYAETYATMRRFTDERDAQTRDELWFLEHPSVYTLGTNTSQAGQLRAVRDKEIVPIRSLPFRPPARVFQMS